MSRMVEVIFTIRTTGEGTEESPCREVSELWSKRGRLLASWDPCDGNGIFTMAFAASDFE